MNTSHGGGTGGPRMTARKGRPEKEFRAAQSLHHHPKPTAATHAGVVACRRRLDPAKAHDYAALIDVNEHWIWRRARLDAIAEVQKNAIDEYLRAAPDGHTGYANANWRCFHIATASNWLPDRPPRRMPPAHRVAAFWAAQDGPFIVDHSVPQCFRCGIYVSEWRVLQRAHLVDRWAGGLDHEANLVMLCALCHRVMPVFLPGEDERARRWVLNGTGLAELLWPTYADGHP